MVMCIVSSVVSATIVSIGVVAASEITAKAKCHAAALCDDVSTWMHCNYYVTPLLKFNKHQSMHKDMP